MGRRGTNLALLALLVTAFLTGWLAFQLFDSRARAVLALHAAAGIGILLLVPWKSVIARRGLRRRRPLGWASLVLAALLVLSLLFGFLHSVGLPYLYFADLTAMEVHVGAALAAIPFVVWHVLARPQAPRRTDLSRRGLLRAGTLALAAGLAYGASELGLRAGRLPGAARRQTGSYELGSHEPAATPATQWMFDQPPIVDPGRLSLVVATPDGSRSYRYEELAGFRDRLTATLDCTGGWFAEQDWEGVWLERLLGSGIGRRATSVNVVSATGYGRRFSLPALPRLLLATRAEGQELDPGHGAPLRLVAAGERGFWWVKWVTRIQADDLPAWWQSPFPLQ